jgi:hypothetical protein
MKKVSRPTRALDLFSWYSVGGDATGFDAELSVCGKLLNGKFLSVISKRVGPYEYNYNGTFDTMEVTIENLRRLVDEIPNLAFFSPLYMTNYDDPDLWQVMIRTIATKLDTVIRVTPRTVCVLRQLLYDKISKEDKVEETYLECIEEDGIEEEVKVEQTEEKSQLAILPLASPIEDEKENKMDQQSTGTSKDDKDDQKEASLDIKKIKMPKIGKRDIGHSEVKRYPIKDLGMKKYIINEPRIDLVTKTLIIPVQINGRVEEYKKPASEGYTIHSFKVEEDIPLVYIYIVFHKRKAIDVNAKRVQININDLEWSIWINNKMEMFEKEKLLNKATMYDVELHDYGSDDEQKKELDDQLKKEDANMRLKGEWRDNEQFGVDVSKDMCINASILGAKFCSSGPSKLDATTSSVLGLNSNDPENFGRDVLVNSNIKGVVGGIIYRDSRMTKEQADGVEATLISRMYN